MNAKEYKEYQQDVDAFFKREGIQNLSTKYDEETGENEESFFSWYPCECCGSTLGGDREHCDGWNPTLKEVQEYTVCVDCVYYAEYGQLGDMAMLEIEHNERLAARKAADKLMRSKELKDRQREARNERSGDLETPSDYPQDYNSAAQDLMDPW